MYCAEPWFDDFRCIPQSLHNEFAAAASQYAKVVEVNLHATLLNKQYPKHFKQQYAEYIAGLHAAGITLSIGSDHHSQHSHYHEIDFALAEEMLSSVGLQHVKFWSIGESYEIL
jgi:hypothetical protein